MVPLLVILTIVTFLTIDYFAQRSKQRQAIAAGAPRGVSLHLAHQAAVSGAARAETERIPGDAFVAPGHTWVRIDPGGTARIGVDRLPGMLLGKIDRTTVVKPGAEVQRGQPLAFLEHRGRRITVRSPLDGVVTRVNSKAQTDPSQVRTDPFGSGWLAHVQPSRLGAALRGMFIAEEASSFMRREFRRLRDLLSSIPAGDTAPAATMADGGLPADGLAARLDEACWNEVVDRMFGAGCESHGDPER